MFNVSGTTAPLLVNVKIGNEIVTMEADSGAAISVMSVNNFNNLKLYDYSTRKTDDTVRSVTGTEKVHSIVTVPVTVHGETYRLDLRLLDTSCPNLYGRDWILATNVSIDNIMKEISKLSTVDIMQLSDHGNEMQPTSDHGNVMQPQSDHGNVMQPIDKNNVCDVLDFDKLEQSLQPYHNGNVSLQPYHNGNVYTIDQMPNLCKDLLSKHQKLFSSGLGKFSKGEAQIIVDQSKRPIYTKARPLPYAIKEKVEDELLNMVNQNIIVPVSHSDWAAPIVPIQKTNGDIRICGDFKVTVNKVSKPDSYPIPRIEDLYAKLSGGKVFSVLDLSMAYQQIVVSEESKSYLTINTTKGLFAFNRLPAGISAAPGIFQRLMDALFAKISGVCVYLDDILVSGKDEKDHEKNLDLVFTVLSDAGLKLKREKCLLAQDSVTYLGHIIDSRGLRPVKKKVEAIHKAPEPKNVAELQSFIGLLCYYSKFLPNLSTVMAPLYELLKKDVPWDWGKEQSLAFKQCKTLLHCDSLLVHYDPDKPLVLACDASMKGIGCVLSHVIDEVERPIAFYSRTLKPAEKNYSVLDKEALAVVNGVKKFHCYLYGRSFMIQSDHKPLEKLLHEKNNLSHMAAPRIKRWSLELSAYDYAWKYRSGKSMCHADALSRLPLDHGEGDEVPQPAEVVFLLQKLDYSPVTSEHIKTMTRRDPVLSKVSEYVTTGWPTDCANSNLSVYFQKQNEISIENGCLLWGTRVIIPTSGHKAVLELLHECHPGIVKMKSIARRVCWWPKIDSDIESFVQNCGNCQSQVSLPSLSTVHPWEWPGIPWHRIHVDYAGPINGKMYLIIIDSFSKWLEIIPTESATAEVTIKALREVMSRWGLPLMLVSDNGPCFTL